MIHRPRKTLPARQQADHPAIQATPPDVAQQIAPLYPSIEPGTRVKAGDRDNIGEVLEDLGDACKVRFVSPEGTVAIKNLPKTLLRFADSGRSIVSQAPHLKIVPQHYHALLQEYPELRPEVIHGLLRQGETANFIASPKVGKSFLSMGLAWSIATGRDWLGFTVETGKVLIIDNELHGETLSHRMEVVADALQIPQADRDRLSGAVLRGQNLSMDEIVDRVGVEKGEYRLIVIDALYRTLPEGASENDNAAMMRLYNLIDAFADRTGAAVAVIHHSSKGDQSGKGLTDIGSGAGSISRAADVHAAIREHEEPGFCVLEAKTRSFKSPEPVSIQFQYPLWYAVPLAPEVRRPGRVDKDRQQAEDSRASQSILDAVGDKGISQAELIRRTGFGVGRIKRLTSLLERDGRLAAKMRRKKSGKQKILVYTKPVPETVSEGFRNG